MSWKRLELQTVRMWCEERWLGSRQREKGRDGYEARRFRNIVYIVFVARKVFSPQRSRRRLMEPQERNLFASIARASRLNRKNDGPSMSVTYA
jgi:hypothetical protein